MLRARIFQLDILSMADILILTVPNTPLNDADHVGSFNLLGEINERIKRTSAIDNY